MMVTAGSCIERREPTPETSPSWSPDGGRHAFAYDGDIYVADDGAGRTNLTGSTEDDRQPTWSPSGDRIAFFTRGQQGSDIQTGTVAIAGAPPSTGGRLVSVGCTSDYAG